MSGLLDFLATPESQQWLGLLGAAGPTSDPNQAGFGARLQAGFGYAQKQQEVGLRRKQAEAVMQMQQMQMQEARAKMAQEAQIRELAQRFQTPAQQGLSPLQGNAESGILPSAGRAAVPAGFDRQGYGNALEAINPMAGLTYQQAIQKDDTPVHLKEGESLYSGKASGYKPLVSIPKTHTDPAAMQEYQFAKSQGFPGSFMDFELAKRKASQPNMTAITNVNAFEPFKNKVQGEMGTALVKSFDTLQNIPQTLQALDAAKSSIPKAGAFVGSFAEQKLGVAKFFNNNFGTSIDPSGVANAETLGSTLFYNVMDNLKKMDAQPSQKQQEIMMKAFGTITTDPGALPKIIDFYRGQVLSKATEHNRRVDQTLAGPSGIQFPYDIHVNVPKPGMTPVSPAAPTPMKGMVRGGYRFKGGDPADQNNWEQQ